MAGLRFKYNPEECRYEPYQVRGSLLWKKIALFVITSIFTAAVGFTYYVNNFDSFDEYVLAERNKKLKVKWSVLEQRIKGANQNLQELIDRDDNTYRVLLDSEPLPASVREAGSGGRENISLSSGENYDYILGGYRALEKLEHKVDIETQSYGEIEEMFADKLAEWAARPAIQPINNTQLTRLYLTYGARLHPIFKVWKDHKGLDFAAPEGTPVYATGDGKVVNAYFSGSYGKVVFIDHNDHFQTRYAHLHRYIVIPGQPVKRGQIIGYVGDTGNSNGPHLHYEILVNGKHVNPINFFQRDLPTEEYQRLISVSSDEMIH